MSIYTIYDRAGNQYTTNELSYEAIRDLENAVVNQPADYILKISLGAGLDGQVLTIRATNIISITQHLS